MLMSTQIIDKKTYGELHDLKNSYTSGFCGLRDLSFRRGPFRGEIFGGNVQDFSLKTAFATQKV